MNERIIVAEKVRTAKGVLGNAIHVAGDRIIAIGEASAMRGLRVAEERFPGGTIIPGLRDAHFHPVSYAAALAGTSLKRTKNFDQLAEQLRSAATGLDPKEPVVAVRLDDETLEEGRLPTRIELDAALPDRAVLLHRYCGHVAVANSAALQAGGVDAQTPNPPGGVIDRDGSGAPTGVLRETAIELVATALSSARSVTAAALVDALRGLAGLGLTSIGGIVGCGDGPWATLGDESKVLLEAAAALPINVHALVIANTVDQVESVKREFSDVPAAAGRHRLRWLGLKRFSDGSLGGHTAAMHQPFADLADTTGMLRLTAGDTVLAKHALDLGGFVAIHAIGDRACTEVIDLFTALIAEGAAPDRLRLEHASVLTRRDIARLAELGVTVSVQPPFMGSETEWLERRVGSERLQTTYPLRSLLDAGAHLAGGSDCPVEVPHPLSGMALARDRAGIMPSEGLSAEEALHLYTAGAARALGEPEPLAIGTAADLVVLDIDPVEASPDELRGANVLETFVGGEPVPVDRSKNVWMD